MTSAEGPTTVNGPLHSDEVSLGDRQITAYFDAPEHAAATRDAIIAAGVEPGRVIITGADAQAAELKPADDTLIGRVRETLLPDDGTRGTRAAVKEGLTMLTVAPGSADAGQIVAIIEAGKPARFDAALELWRNSPPSS